MTNIIVLSDTHGQKKLLSAIRPLLLEADAIIFLGDQISDIADIKREYGNVALVPGNCDYFSSLPRTIVYEAEGKRLLLTHGHDYGVKSGLDKLAYAAKEKNCECALYGHTHIADCQTVGGIMLLNPGSLLPRIGPASYAYMTLIAGSPILYRIVPLLRANA